MNSFEINKIIAAILFTVLLIYGIGKISDLVFEVKNQDVVAYKVEAPEGTAVKASAETSVDLSALIRQFNVLERYPIGVTKEDYQR